MKKIYLISFLIVISFIGFLSITIDKPITKVSAQSNTIPMFRGYAWSQNIGWIRMSDCDMNVVVENLCDYGVSYNPITGYLGGPTGEAIGYAWAPNMGWIQFGGLSSFPTGAIGAVADNAKLISNGPETKRLVGWAKVLPTSTHEGRWINLKSDSPMYGVMFNSTTGSPMTSSTWPGNFAWGAETIGWINFSGVTMDIAPIPTTPDLSFYANPQVPIYVGDTAQLYWFGSNLSAADACEMSSNPSFQAWDELSLTSSPDGPGDISGSKDLTFNTKGDYLFRLSCTGIDNVIIQKSVNVSVIQARCDDLIQNGGETGVDCGTVCNKICSVVDSCKNNIQDNGEDGVDCGPVCNNICGVNSGGKKLPKYIEQ